MFSENAAYTQTSVVTSSALATTTTTSATTPHVQRLSLSQPLEYENVDFSTLSVMLAITSAATSIVRVYGLGMHVVICYS